MMMKIYSIHKSCGDAPCRSLRSQSEGKIKAFTYFFFLSASFRKLNEEGSLAFFFFFEISKTDRSSVTPHELMCENGQSSKSYTNKFVFLIPLIFTPLPPSTATDDDY